MVLESDVRPVENALVFFREVVDMYVKKWNHEKTKNLQFINLATSLEDRSHRDRLSHLPNTILKERHVSLLTSPRLHERTQQVGQGMRGYLIHAKLMTRLVSQTYKWYNWIDLQVFFVQVLLYGPWTRFQNIISCLQFFGF